ncbi:MAG: aminopeptidase [Candidatus Aenigmatarchaeota archaeon]
MLSEKEMQKIAKSVININLAVKEKEVTLISCGPKSLKFAEALALEAAKVGAQPTITYGSDELNFKIYKVIKIKYLKQWPKLADALSRLVDAKIVIDDTNPFIARKLPQYKIEIRRKTVKPIKEIEERRQKKKEMKAALIGFPTEEIAEALEIPFKKLEKIFWDAMKADYEKIYEYNKKIIQKLKNANNIRVIGERTDLEFSVKGRKFINACGLVTKKGEIGYVNLPDGEVFCPPVENSVNGEIYFDLPCMWHYGKQVEGVWFKFEKGRVVDYEIEKGKENFEDVFKHASGDKDKIGEFAIGTNPRAKSTGGMTIVDEKIRGTIHFALGHNKHFGGKNDSTIHWDFFKDMRHGEVYVDGKLLMKNGKIV